MKKRKTIYENDLVYRGRLITITNENGELFFEIKNNITTDIAEAVSMMIMLDIKEEKVWEIEYLFPKEIDPEKSLYWLSGGDKEWLTLEHYHTNWINCANDFCEKYSTTVLESIKSSKNLGEVRDFLNKKLNLPILYNFALSKGFVK